MRLELGQVFLLPCQTCSVPKPKFFVVVLLEPLRFFLINSQATPFQLARPDQMQALAPILAAENASFLKRDSYIACNALFAEYTAEEVAAAVANDPWRYKGFIDEHAFVAIARALDLNRMLPSRYLENLRSAWSY